MTTPSPSIRKMLDKAQRRFVRSRPGSVLILVVALLVLMALIGTAYMSMAQADRVATAQHSFNTEVDLLVEGVINQVNAVLSGDLFINGQYRPATYVTTNASGVQIVNYYNTGQLPSYNYVSGLGFDIGTPQVVAGAVPGNWWLSSRQPGLSGNDAMAPAATNFPLWPFITGAINGAPQFDTPYWEPNAGTFPVRYSQRSQVVPFATDVQVDGQIWPAFTGVPGYTKPILAADTDGDGIADAGLVKLFALDGITYYAAVRIVDNSAAINASIAQTPNPFSNYVASQQMPGDLSPVNLDLEGMLVNPGSTYAQWSAPPDFYGSSPNQATATGPGLLTNFRYNKPATTTLQTLSPTAIDENGVARSDFVYMPYPFTYQAPNPLSVNYIFDQQWMQLGRRLRNPGYIAPKSAAFPTDPTKFYQALPISEGIAMARGFVLRDPTVASAASSSSILEMRMPNTVYTAAVRNSPYPPANTLAWFSDNFDFATNLFLTNPPAPNVKPMRSILVPQNPVSNFVPGKFNLSPITPYQFGDTITVGGYKYVCICPNPPAMPVVPDPHWTDPNWAYEPWTNAPTKTSVNTGTFQQLYAAYWAAMADQFVPGKNNTTPGQWAPAFPTAAAPTASRMFRSPIRGVGTAGATTQPTDPTLSNQQVMELRAAIAAVNTMALRHGDPATIATYGTNDVISRTVTLPAPAGGIAFQANVYGVERQPYLTQIYARNDADAKNDWMAVEFYNPYPDKISLQNWVLATLDRSNPAALKITNVGGASLQTAAPGLVSIPGNSFIVLISSKTIPSTIQLASVPANFYECTGLTDAFGKELVLLRPRLTSTMASGTSPPASAVANNTYTESVTTPDDLVPIDSYDFTNIPAVSPDKNPQEWRYIRPNDPTFDKQWHFVYPGPWMLPATPGAPSAPTLSKPPTWSGTYVTPTPLPAGATILDGQLGVPSKAQPAGLPWASYHDTALQVNNVDFGGPLKANATGTNNSLPLGAFPRNGDILQVTFVGSYKLSPLNTPHTIYELNPVAADSAMATACDQTDGQEPMVSQSNPQVVAENVGRFAPIDTTDAAAAAAPAVVDDFGTTTPANWRYHWASRIFDFLTVQSPQDDYFPNVDPWLNDANYPTAYRYTPASTAGAPEPVANVNLGAANAGLVPPNPVVPANPVSEDTAPVDGLVNVNAAPWRVLAAVPWVPATQANYRITNATIAIGLAHYRDVDDGSGAGRPHGPFRNLFELGEAKISTLGGKRLRDILQNANSSNFNLAMGNLTPLNGNSSGVKGDFQALYNTIDRISNLVTTRSDSYTAYILVQGWRNAETATPHLVVQRRTAIIIDRSAVTPVNRTPNDVIVP